mgnify:CR=1 FL=1
MANVRAIHFITHSGSNYNPGEVIKGISKEEAERLRKLGAASFLDVYEAEETEEEQPKKADAKEELRNSLDQYTLKELRDLSEVYGIDLDSKANKKTVIETIIASGKADMFFED